MSDLSALPQTGDYGCILADPPWRFETYSKKGRGRCPDGAVNHYPTLSRQQILSLPVGALAARDCFLALWVTDPMWPFGIQVGEAWGFTFKTVGFYWMKSRAPTKSRASKRASASRPFPMGTGYWTRANPEACLFFTKGKPKRLSRSVEKLIVSPRREHSRKPDEQYERLTQLVDGPYIELFARQRHPNWTAWGNETNRFPAVKEREG